MKNKKKLIGFTIGLACVVLCVLLLLTTCNGNSKGDSTTNLNDETQMAAVDEATEVPEETDPSEDETEPTEETTEPTEESSSGGSSRPGGTSGFAGSTATTPSTDSNTGSDNTDEPVVDEIVVDNPGTQKVAYTEYLTEIPDTFTSVQIPAGSSMYYNIYYDDAIDLSIENANAYVIYGGVTYGADENGVVRVRMASAGADVPISLQIGNASTAAEVYPMEFSVPVGSAGNPEVIEDVSEITVTMDADHADGYYYSWTAPYDAALVMNVKSIAPEGLKCDVILSVGDKRVSLSESTDGTVAIDALEGEAVIIQVVVTPEGSEAQVVLNGIVKGEPGSAYNPYELYAKLGTSCDTATIPAGAYVYYHVYDAGGMNLVFADTNAYVIYDNVTYGADGEGAVSVRIAASEDGSPALLIIGNSGTADAAFTVSFAYPQGGSDNPEVLEDLGTMTASVSSAFDGYYYNWTAHQTGVLSVNVENVVNLTSAQADVSYDIAINNLTQKSAMTLSSDGWTSGFGCPTVSNLVNKGDEIEIVVTVEGESTIAQFTMQSYVSGTKSSQFYMSADLVKIPVASGSDVYAFTKVGEQILTIENAQDLTLYIGDTQYVPNANGVINLVTPEADMQNPVEMRLVSTSSAAKTYTLSFTYPLGSYNNPQQLQLGQVAVNVPAGSDDGYYYVWTAEDEGELVVTVAQADAELAKITLTNQATYEIADEAVLNEDGSSTTVMEVSAGQKVLVNVASADTNYPAVSMTMNAAFAPVYGSKADPIWLNTFDNQVTVPAGKTRYFAAADVDGMLATITGENLTVLYEGETYAPENGGVSMTVSSAGADAPCLIGITNSASEDVSCGIVFTYPLGHKMKPEVVTSVSSLTATVAAGSDSYYYSWKATKSGVLTSVIPVEGASGYEIVITNQSQNTEMKLSTEGWVNGFEYPAVSNLITKGDQILIGVTVAKSDADVTVSISNTIWGTSSTQFYMSSEIVKVPVVSGTAVYAYTRNGGQILTIENASDLTLTLRDTVYTADENGVINLVTPETDNTNPLEMTLTTTSKTVKTYTLHFEYPLGDLYNPEPMTPGTIAVDLAAGSDDGYYYCWTAETDGEISVSAADTSLVNATLLHQGNYDTISIWQYDTEAGKDVATSPITMSVSAGDEVYLNVVSHSTSFPEVHTTVEVSFKAAAPAALTMEEEPVGTEENPEKVEKLDEIKVTVAEGSVGYYYSYIAEENGKVTFSIDEESMPENLRTNIVLINQRTEEESELWLYENEKYVEQESVCVEASAGDEILILVSVTVPTETYVEREDAVCVAAEVTICGSFESAEAAANAAVVAAVAAVSESPAAEAEETSAPAAEETPSEPAETEAPAADETVATEAE